MPSHPYPCPPPAQGLALFVRAVALGAESAGVGLCSAEVLTLLKQSLLQPIVAQDKDGSYQAHRPSVGEWQLRGGRGSQQSLPQRSVA